MNKIPDVVVMGSHAAGTGQARVHKLPSPGESITAWKFNIIKDGGKASHKAMILSKYGVNVGFIGMMGTDQRSKIGIQWLIDHHVNIDKLLLVDDYRISEAGSLMLLDDNGNNMIIMIESVKKRLTFEQAEPLIKDYKDAKIFITDFEIPFDTAMKGIKLAKELGMYTVLNPSPIPDQPLGILDFVDLICPNETEAKMMLEIPLSATYDPLDLCERLIKRYQVRQVVITLGADGAIYHDKDETCSVPSLKIKAVDPSGAGDNFISSFLYAHNICGKSISTAMDWANHAAALSVSRPGSIDSFPTKQEVDAFTIDFNEYH